MKVANRGTVRHSSTCNRVVNYFFYFVNKTERTFTDARHPLKTKIRKKIDVTFLVRLYLCLSNGCKNETQYSMAF